MKFYKNTRIGKRNRKSYMVNVGKIYLAIVWMALALSSCVGALGEQGEGKDALLRLTFNPGGTRSRALSDGESTITDINVLVFNSAGALTGSAYATFAGGNYTMDVSARTGEGCSIYAIANTGSAAYFKGVTTITDFKKKYVALASDPAELGNASKTVMFGKKTGVKIDAQTAITAADNFALTRLCAKMSFTIKPATGITVTGYQLCHVPMGSYITDETSTAYYNPPSAVFKDFSAVAVTTSAGTSVSGINYYMYENLAGKGTNPSAETRTATYAPINATYLIVYAKTNDWHSTYRIYLGGANSSDYADYNIPRNYNYNYNINIGGPGIKDVRVIYLPNIGNYYYSDGTWGANANPSGKRVIGVIFSDATSNLDKAKGWTHGYAMALTNASPGCQWDDGSFIDTPELTNTSSDLIKLNKDGYTETKAIKDHRNISSTSFSAFYYTLRYGIDNNTQYAAPSNSSGWYLPSIGQWYDILVNLGKMSPSVNIGIYTDAIIWYPITGSGETNQSLYTSVLAANNINAYLTPLYNYTVNTFGSSDYYWSSSEFNNKIAFGTIFYAATNNQLYLDAYNPKNSGFIARSVIAF